MCCRHWRQTAAGGGGIGKGIRLWHRYRSLVTCSSGMLCHLCGRLHGHAFAVRPSAFQCAAGGGTAGAAAAAAARSSWWWGEAVRWPGGWRRRKKKKTYQGALLWRVPSKNGIPCGNKVFGPRGVTLDVAARHRRWEA
eukprot:gene16717-biopygen9809